MRSLPKSSILAMSVQVVERCDLFLALGRKADWFHCLLLPPFYPYLPLWLYLERVENFTSDGWEAFQRDEKTQYAVIRAYEVIGEAAKRLPAELLQRQPNVNWQRIKGFRELLDPQLRQNRLEGALGSGGRPSSAQASGTSAAASAEPGWRGVTVPRKKPDLKQRLDDLRQEPAPPVELTLSLERRAVSDLEGVSATASAAA